MASNLLAMGSNLRATHHFNFLAFEIVEANTKRCVAGDIGVQPGEESPPETCQAGAPENWTCCQNQYK